MGLLRSPSPRSRAPQGVRARPPGEAQELRSPPWPLEQEPEEIQARFRWARRQGHPRYPWPDVPVQEWRSALREVEEVTRVRLAGASARLVAPGPGRARAFAVAAYTSGMGPLLGAWASEGSLEVDGALGTVLAWHLAHGRGRVQRFGEELERASEALQRVGVRLLVLKAGHTARVYFPEPGCRPSADLDLMVPAAAWEEAEGALEEEGYHRRGGQRRPLRSEWLAPGSSTRLRSLELTHEDDPYALDLHATLARDYFGVATVDLPPSTRPFHEVGPGLDVLAQPALLVFQALHASEGLHGLTLIRLVELVLMARKDLGAGGPGEAEVVSFLEEIQAARFVYPALTLAERLAPGTFGPALLEAAEEGATERMRRFFRGMAPSDAQRPTRRSLAESFLWCGTPRDYLARLLHMARPTPASDLSSLAGLYLERMLRVLRGRVGFGS